MVALGASHDRAWALARSVGSAVESLCGGSSATSIPSILDKLPAVQAAVRRVLYAHQAGPHSAAAASMPMRAGAGTARVIRKFNRHNVTRPVCPAPDAATGLVMSAINVSDPMPTHAASTSGFASEAVACLELVPGGERRQLEHVLASARTRLRESDTDASFRTEWEVSNHRGHKSRLTPASSRSLDPVSNVRSYAAMWLKSIDHAVAPARAVDLSSTTQSDHLHGLRDRDHTQSSNISPDGSTPLMQTMDQAQDLAQAQTPTQAPTSAPPPEQSVDAATVGPPVLVSDLGRRAVDMAQLTIPGPKPTVRCRSILHYLCTSMGVTAAARSTRWLAAWPPTAPSEGERGAAWALQIRGSPLLPISSAEVLPSTERLPSWCIQARSNVSQPEAAVKVQPGPRADGGIKVVLKVPAAAPASGASHSSSMGSTACVLLQDDMDIGIGEGDGGVVSNKGTCTGGGILSVLPFHASGAVKLKGWDAKGTTIPGGASGSPSTQSTVANCLVKLHIRREAHSQVVALAGSTVRLVVDLVLPAGTGISGGSHGIHTDGIEGPLDVMQSARVASQLAEDLNTKMGLGIGHAHLLAAKAEFENCSVSSLTGARATLGTVLSSSLVPLQPVIGLGLERSRASPLAESSTGSMDSTGGVSVRWMLQLHWPSMADTSARGIVDQASVKPGVVEVRLMASLRLSRTPSIVDPASTYSPSGDRDAQPAASKPTPLPVRVMVTSPDGHGLKHTAAKTVGGTGGPSPSPSPSGTTDIVVRGKPILLGASARGTQSSSMPKTRPVALDVLPASQADGGPPNPDSLDVILVESIPARWFGH